MTRLAAVVLLAAALCLAHASAVRANVGQLLAFIT